MMPTEKEKRLMWTFVGIIESLIIKSNLVWQHKARPWQLLVLHAFRLIYTILLNY
jgi:hypothetical protein